MRNAGLDEAQAGIKIAGIERTRWQRSKWTWSTSLSTDPSGIHLQAQKCMQNTSCEMLGWMKHKLESRLLGEICKIAHLLRYADDTTLMAESEEELKSLLMKVKEESKKVGLKLNILKLRSWHLVPLLHSK